MPLQVKAVVEVALNVPEVGFAARADGNKVIAVIAKEMRMRKLKILNPRPFTLFMLFLFASPPVLDLIVWTPFLAGR